MAGRAASTSLPVAALGIALLLPLAACDGRGDGNGGPLTDTSADVADVPVDTDAGDATDTPADTVGDTAPGDTDGGDIDATPGVVRAIVTTSGSAGLLRSANHRAFVGVGTPQPMGTTTGDAHTLITGPGAARP